MKSLRVDNMLKMKFNSTWQSYEETNELISLVEYAHMAD